VSFLDALESFLNGGWVPGSSMEIDVISQITTKTVKASWCVLWTLAPTPEGDKGGCVVGVIHPWGNTDPVSICVKIQTHHHFETRGPQSVSHHHDSAGRGNPLPLPILSNFFGGFFGNKYIYVFF